MAAKTVAGFLNAQGGVLLIGVNDAGDVLGIGMDLRTLKRQDNDGFEQILRAGLATHLGPDISPLISIQFYETGACTVAVVTCPAHTNPTFFREGDRQEFYVRDGNLTRPLDVKATHEYIRARWRLEKAQEPGLAEVKAELLGAVPSLEAIRRMMGEVLAGYGVLREELPAPRHLLPPWLKVATARVLDLFLSTLSRSPQWRQLFIISPWISEIDSSVLSTPTLLRRLSDDQATAYVVTRPPGEEWHRRAIDRFGAGGRANVALLPELHMKLFVAVTAETTIAMLGSANFTAQSFANREIGVLVNSTGEGAAVARELKREAAQVYRSNARSLVHKARFTSGR